MLLKVAADVRKPLELKRILLRTDAVSLRDICVDDWNSLYYRLENPNILVIRPSCNPWITRSGSRLVSVATPL